MSLTALNFDFLSKHSKAKVFEILNNDFQKDFDQLEMLLLVAILNPKHNQLLQ